MADRRLVEIDSAMIDGVKAGLVKREVRITLIVPFDQITQTIQEDLAFMDFMEMSCEVSIEGKQKEMQFGKAAK